MALRFLNSGYFAGKVGIGTDNPTSGLTISSSAGGDHTWDESGILIENLATTTGECAVVFKNSGTLGTGSDYWFTGLNQSNIYRLAYGENFENGYTLFQLSSLGALTLDAYDSTNNTGTPTYLLGTDASGNVVKTNTVPGSAAGPYLPLAGGTLTGNTNLTGSTKKLILKLGAQLGFEDAAPTGTIYLYNDGGATSRLNIGGTMWVEEAGNVGIGTSTPDQKLHIEFANTDTSFDGGSGGDWGGEGIRIENTSNTVDTMAILHLRNNDADVHIASIRRGSNDSDLGFFFEGDEKVRFTNDGKVGIGTTSPDYLLDLYKSTSTTSSTTGTTLQQLWNYVGSDINQQKTFIDFVFQDDNDNEYPQVRIGAEVGQNGNSDTQIKEGSGAFVVYTNNATGDGPGAPTGLAERFRVDYSGKVGIGTADPARLLHVNSSGQTDIHLTSSDQGTASTDGMTVFLDSSGSGGLWLREAQALRFATSSSERMRIDSSGNVGIRTTSVQANTSLDVRGNGTASDAAIKAYAYGESGTSILGNGYATSGSGTNYGIRGLSTGPRSTVAGSVNVGGYFDASQAETNYALITGTGNVGIGTNTPGDKLHVEGGIIIQNGNNLQWGGLYSAGAPTIYGSTNYLHFVPTGSTGAAGRQMRLDITGLGIGTSSPSEKLDVNGNVKIKDALLSNQENTDVDTGAEVVAQVSTSTYTAAFFDFVVKKGTNVRSGTVYACHNGDTTPLVEFTETSTNDLGDTSDVTLSVDISGTNMRLLATVTSDDWSVKSLIRAI
jgi:hypothetical protein